MAYKDLHEESFHEGTIASLKYLNIMRSLGFQRV